MVRNLLNDFVEGVQRDTEILLKKVGLKSLVCFKSELHEGWSMRMLIVTCLSIHGFQFMSHEQLEEWPGCIIKNIIYALLIIAIRTS